MGEGTPGSLRLAPEQMPGEMKLQSVFRSEGSQDCDSERSEKCRPARTAKRRCDKPAPTPAVMLHLRSCYVSKAAILTIPVQSVPVENRSPA